MRNPIIVLENLSKKTNDKSYKFKRLYRNIYNLEFHLLAYSNIQSAEGNMTSGVDGKTIDGMSIERLERIILSLKNHSYQPNPSKRVYIEKKNSNKKRPLGIPSTDDKIVMEVVRMILESIYEPTFYDNSHGFRPNKSCHTALNHIKINFNGTKWFIEGDIKACFDSIDHHTLINLLRKRIDDEYFIALIWKFLKAGYMEQWKKYVTYSGTAQGSGMSPILANIYLNELDDFILKYKARYDLGESDKRKINPEYLKWKSASINRRNKYTKTWDNMNQIDKDKAIKEVKGMKKKALKIQRYIWNDKTYKRLNYCRYADDWIIGIIGSKMDGEEVKADIKEYLIEKLKLELSEEKTKITHSSDMARFLGYDITVSNSSETKKNKLGINRRAWNKKVNMYVPKSKWFNKLLEYEALKIKKDSDNKEIWEPLHRGNIKNKTDIEIIRKYNSEIRGLYNYYSMANNATVISNFAYIMEYSMYKTFASKYNTSMRKAIAKYKINGEFGVNYLTKSGLKRCLFYNEGFKRNGYPNTKAQDIMPKYIKYNRHNSIIYRIKAGVCEYCGTNEKNVIVHHVRKLKDLQGETDWERVMIDKNRKTLVVCKKCFDTINKIA